MGSTSRSRVSGTLRMPRMSVVAAVLGLWLLWGAGLILQMLVRGVADGHVEPTNLRPIEASLFGRAPTDLAQEHVVSIHDYGFYAFGYLNHSIWFFVPHFMALALTLKRRELLGEFFAWIILSTLLVSVIFLVFPVMPPWMDGNSKRILLDGFPSDFVNADTNPVAAFPSMHASIPALMGLFFWYRCREDGRPLAWLCFGYAATVGISVVYLGEHWVLDVIGGYAFALMVAGAFVSGTVRRITRVIPRDPVGWMIRTNERLLAPQHAQSPDQEQPPAPLEEPLPRAA